MCILPAPLFVITCVAAPFATAGSLSLLEEGWWGEKEEEEEEKGGVQCPPKSRSN